VVSRSDELAKVFENAVFGDRNKDRTNQFHSKKPGQPARLLWSMGRLVGPAQNSLERKKMAHPGVRHALLIEATIASWVSPQFLLRVSSLRFLRCWQTS
jgi:hypothetical protein